MSKDGKKTGGKDFKPGQSGNPSGRPKSSVHKLLIEKCDERLPKIYEVLFALAEAGNIRAIEILLERRLGKVTDKVKVTATALTTINRPDGSSFTMGRKEVEDEEE